MADLPKFEMVINPDAGSDVEVSFIAFVDKPAIEKNFMAFASKRIEFAVDPKRQIVSGPAMVPDTLIYRKDEQGEYNVFFSKETIEQIALKFFKKDYQKNLNLFHDPSLTLENVTIFESFQSDASRGIKPMAGYEDLPDGTWFISAKIEDPKLWGLVTAGTIKGFSVEGIFSYVKKNDKTAEEMVAEILSRTSAQFDHLITDKPEVMATIKESFEKFFGKFNTTKLVLKDKRECFITSLKIGGKLTIGDKPAPAGKYEFEDGATATVGTDGNIEATAPKPAQPMAKDYTLKDGATVVNISDMVVGGVATAGGVPCAPGDYELQDGTKITVGDGGLITAITPGADPNAVMAAKYKEQFDGLTAKITTQEAAFAQHLTKVDQFMAKTTETINGLVDIVGQLAKAPSTDPAAGSGTNRFGAAEQAETNDERIARLAASFKKLKTA